MRISPLESLVVMGLVIIVLLAIGIPLVALLLKAAVFLFNSIAGLASVNDPRREGEHYSPHRFPEIAQHAGHKSWGGYDGSRGPVPQPSFRKAVGISLFLIVLNAAIHLAVALLVFAVLGRRGNIDDPRVLQAAMKSPLNTLLTLPFTILVDAALLVLLLPTTFLRGFLIMLLYTLIVFLIAAFFGVFLVGFLAVVG